VNQSLLPDDSCPRRVLCAEHRVIQRVVWVLKRLVDRSMTTGELDVETIEQCLTFFKLFTDACHHAKEEDVLFPVLEQRGIPCDGGPIGVMLAEHREGRRLVSEMWTQLQEYCDGNRAIITTFRQTATAYVQLLTQHIHKEDHKLFVMGDRVMTDSDQSDVAQRFEEVACRHYDGKDQKQLAAMADELERRLGE